MSVLLYAVGVVFVVVFLLNFLNLVMGNIERINNGTSSKEERSLVFSFFLGVIGYLLLLVFK